MRLTIYRKMLLGFGVIILLMLTANIYILITLNSVRQSTETTFQTNVKTINAIRQIDSYLLNEEEYGNKHLAEPVRDTLYHGWFLREVANFDLAFDSILALAPTQSEAKLLRRLRLANNWFVRVVTDSPATSPQAGLDFRSAKQERLDSMTAMHQVLDDIVNLNQAAISDAMTGVSTAIARATTLTFFLNVGGLIAAISGAFIIARTLTRPMRALIRGTEKIGRGIFDPISVKTNDEMALLAHAVNQMSARLKQIDTMKTELMHHLSHELRTPIQTLYSVQYLLAEQKVGPMNAEQLKMIASLKRSIDKLSQFSNQFLDIAKIEAGMMEYRLAETDLHQIISRVVDEAGAVAAQKDITLSLAVEPVPSVMADAEKISQVFSNLLSNAVKYTPAGGRIDVNLSHQNKRVQVTVRDSGVGIAHEDLPHIFTKFYQARNVHKASGRGTGIGLALVKSFVVGHGGTVRVQSSPGNGSTFVVNLPAIPSAPHSDAHPAQPSTSQKS